MKNNKSLRKSKTTKNTESSSIFAGMQPAFQHAITGESHLAQLADGSIANEYSFEYLPADWVIERDIDGVAISLHADVIPGYWIDGKFYSFSQLSEMPLAA